MQAALTARKLVIIGGVAGGATLAARARRLNEQAEILLFERGPDVSFANCGLPYHVSGEIGSREKLLLQTPQSLEKALNIRVASNSEVLQIDRQNKVISVLDKNTSEKSKVPYDSLIIATGAAPIWPQRFIEGLSRNHTFVLRNMQDMDKIVSRAKLSQKKRNKALIVGAGFIGLEVAEALRKLNINVTLVEKKDRLLPLLDSEMAAPLLREAHQNGIEVRLGSAATKFKDLEDGLSAEVQDDSTKKIERDEFDFCVLAIGVRPESGLAQEAGLEVEPDTKAVKVSPFMQTSDPNIYAVGDVISTNDLVFPKYPAWVPLGGPANRQARIAADHIFTPSLATPYRGSLGTTIIRFFDLCVGLVGWTEDRLRAKQIPYESTIITAQQHASYFPNATPVVMKVLWEKETGRLIGAQAYGADGVDKRIDVLATAIAAKMSVEDLAHLELAYAPPFGSARDVVNIVGLAAQNLRRELVRGTATLPTENVLDVREKAVASLHPLPGAQSLPLSELRSHLSELDKSKKYTTVCALGKSSYFANRILSQYGFDAQSLLGGLSVRQPQETKTEPVKKTETVSQPAASAAAAAPSVAKEIKVDACGLSCPGPIMEIRKAIDAPTTSEGDVITVKASDPGFYSDFKAFCSSTGMEFLSVERAKGVIEGKLRVPKKSAATSPEAAPFACSTSNAPRSDLSIVVFSGDLDKVLAALVISNGHIASSPNGRVTLFFTFWGLTALRKASASTPPSKGYLDRMMGWMLPKGIGSLGLSQMHWFGMGTWMMKRTMNQKNLPNLPALFASAEASGRVRFVGCTMSMDALGITASELRDGVELGGVADFLLAAQKSNTTLFI